MHIAKIHSHLNGLEWMMVRHPALWDGLLSAITCIDAEAHRTKVSEEKRMAGKLLYSPISLNSAFKVELNKLQWTHSRLSFFVTDEEELIRHTIPMPAKQQKIAITAAGKVPISSFNQTDFVQDKIAIEVQFGKYSFIPYDLFVKHLAFYVRGEINLGIEILPMKLMQNEMSSGPGYYEKALYDLVRQGRGVPAVPLILIGVIPDKMVSLSLDEVELVEDLPPEADPAEA